MTNENETQKLTPKQLKQKFFEATQVAVGAPLDKAVFEKAYAKAKRWTVNAYGGVDMLEYSNESGFDLSCYYEECVKNSAGVNTMNQRQYQENRADVNYSKRGAK